MSDQAMEELLRSHFSRMNEIATEDIEHTRRVQGTIQKIAERSIGNEMKVADELKTEKETTA